MSTEKDQQVSKGAVIPPQTIINQNGRPGMDKEGSREVATPCSSRKRRWPKLAGAEKTVLH